MNQNILLKQILYRSVHRGCKETDFLIGEFAKAKLNEIKDAKLFANFLEEDDLQIYDWILAKENAPEKYQKIITQIRQFHNI
ncbi:MAG: succinate dehydrogenase assembly factor 2 [Rickettsiales bacterium]|nr:succinate dehydrogenase assembly factor 2 [Rickettsiales bacterium]